MSKSPFVYLSRPIAASMEVAKPARRRPHPEGCNEEEDGRDAVFLERSVREEWHNQGKKLRQARAPAVVAIRRRDG